jgi:hypothetical protein
MLWLEWVNMMMTMLMQVLGASTQTVWVGAILVLLWQRVDTWRTLRTLVAYAAYYTTLCVPAVQFVTTVVVCGCHAHCMLKPLYARSILCTVHPMFFTARGAATLGMRAT